MLWTRKGVILNSQRLQYVLSRKTKTDIFKITCHRMNAPGTKLYVLKLLAWA